jgi:hypothetical protein
VCQEFETAAPFFLLSCGNGGNVATCHTGFYTNESVRALLPFDFAGSNYIDPIIAEVLRDSISTLSFSAPSRRGLPVEIDTRPVFGPEVLAKVRYTFTARSHRPRCAGSRGDKAGG